MTGPFVNPWSEFVTIIRQVLTSPGFGWATFILVGYSLLVFIVGWLSLLRDPDSWRRIYSVAFDSPLTWCVFALCVGVMLWIGV